MASSTSGEGGGEGGGGDGGGTGSPSRTAAVTGAAGRPCGKMGKCQELESRFQVRFSGNIFSLPNERAFSYSR